ncbi:MAG TPA: hypothetical protein VHB73_05455 [Alphaproteobacteria bacterium]|nr:hypothetical protein [Alphaproteobacteria bacterium]
MSFSLSDTPGGGVAAENESEETRAPGTPQDFYFPPEMIGGSSPQVKGDEEQLAWQAAAEACDSERLHFIWRAHEGRVWYLAVRSQDLASHPKSWCPLGALLPGQPDAHEPPVIYTYYSTEAATIMAVDKEGMQLIRGTASIVRAKVERMARDMGGAEVFDLVPDEILKLKPVNWDSLSLLEERARRFLAMALVGAGLVVIIGAFFVWFLASVSLMTSRADLSDLRTRTQTASMQLQQSATILRTSEMREQIAAFNRVNENLVDLQGWLKLYQIQDGRVKWWAEVPASLTSQPIQAIGAQSVDTSPDGSNIIANDKDSYVRKGAK